MYQSGLFKAIRYFGTQQKLARAIGVTQPAVSQWLCRDLKIPYAQAVKILGVTDGYLSLEELVPEAKEANRAVQRLLQTNASSTIEIPVHLIDQNDQCCPIWGDNKATLVSMPLEEWSRPIVIDENNRLITCVCRLQVQILQGYKRVKVWILNGRAVTREEQNIHALLALLPISERIALGQWLEKYVGNRRGQRTDLSQLPQYIAEVVIEGGTETRHMIAKWVGFGNHETYRLAKKVIQSGLPPLIQAMDRRMVSIPQALQLFRKPESEQLSFIKQIASKKKR